MAEEIEPGKTNLVCEFCECRLAASGQVLTRSDRAKVYIGQESEIDRLRADTDARDKTIADLKAEIAALKPPAGAAKKSLTEWPE